MRKKNYKKNINEINKKKLTKIAIKLIKKMLINKNNERNIVITNKSRNRKFSNE